MDYVQFGLIVPEYPLHAPRRQHYMEDVDQLLTAVKGHYDSAWCIDHLEGLVMEGWTALTYLAALHPELLWGHSVLCQSFRNPALLAKSEARCA
jgi:alkanesulfonate monooxygenase SsuD/methylene tetrahydromethanopterin reductase-like flavin-dependent oxidoreductase (luciferase family)